MLLSSYLCFLAVSNQVTKRKSIAHRCYICLEKSFIAVYWLNVCVFFFYLKNWGKLRALIVKAKTSQILLFQWIKANCHCPVIMNALPVYLQDFTSLIACWHQLKMTELCSLSKCWDTRYPQYFFYLGNWSALTDYWFCTLSFSLSSALVFFFFFFFLGT